MAEALHSGIIRQRTCEKEGRRRRDKPEAGVGTAHRFQVADDRAFRKLQVATH